MHLGSVLQPSEAVIYSYMCHLKLDAAPAVASSFLEAWRFLHASVGIRKVDSALVISASRRGSSSNARGEETSHAGRPSLCEDGEGFGANCPACAVHALEDHCRAPPPVSRFILQVLRLHVLSVTVW